MDTIHVVRGVDTAPMEMASYDVALAAANIHNYSFIVVSSVVPAGATVEAVDVAPDLDPVGSRLTVVQARETTATSDETVVAGLDQVTGSGPGLFYKASGINEDSVHAAVIDGFEVGRNLREWSFDDEEIALITGAREDEGYTTVITVAAYGQGESVF